MYKRKALQSLYYKGKARLFSVFRMVGVTGFEPAASWSRTKRSTELSHTPIFLLWNPIYFITVSHRCQPFSEKMLHLTFRFCPVY